jgi:hypothetical protein
MGHLPNDSLLYREYCAFSADAEAGNATIRKTLCATALTRRTTPGHCTARATQQEEVRIPTYRIDG